MAKKKPLKFIIMKRAKGFYYCIESSNGNNLAPTDPQKRKRTVKNAIGSLVSHIQGGNYEIIDET